MSTFCQNASGRSAKLYYNDNTVASPNWVAVNEAQDITINFSADEIDNPDRGSLFKLYEAGQIELSIEFSLTYRNGGVNAAEFRDRILDGCAEEFAVMFGDINTSGVEGIRAGCKVFSNTINWPISGLSTVDVTLKPSYFEDTGVPGVGVYPGWYVVP